MKKLFIHPLVNALFSSDLISTRIVLAIAEMLWCIMLLWPGDTFARPTYTILSILMPELCWAFVFGVSAFLQFHIAVSQCWYEHWARVFATWNASLWVLVVGSMILSVYPPPAAIGGEVALTLAAIWIWAQPLLIVRGKNYGK